MFTKPRSCVEQLLSEFPWLWQLSSSWSPHDADVQVTEATESLLFGPLPFDRTENASVWTYCEYAGALAIYQVVIEPGTPFAKLLLDSVPDKRFRIEHFAVMLKRETGNQITLYRLKKDKKKGDLHDLIHYMRGLPDF